MPKGIVLIGSGDYRKKECFDVDKKIVEMVGADANFLVIPFAVPEKEKREKRFSAIKGTYLGLGVTKIEMLDDTYLSSFEMKDKINHSSVLYLSGGDPKTLLSCLEKNDLKNSIIDFPGVIVGFSAGAMILPKEGLILGGLDETYSETTFFEGLGLVDFSISPHYTDSQDGELISLSQSRQIYALANASAIISLEGQIKLHGQVYSFNLGKKNHD